MASFHLQIITPEKILFNGDVDSLVAPGLDGYFGVLAHHAPLIAALGEGHVEIRIGRRPPELWQIKGGFFEMLNNRAVLLADAIQRETTGDSGGDEAASPDAPSLA